VTSTLLQVSVVDDAMLIVQLEIHPRVCRAVYRASGRKASQCVDYADVWILEIDLENVTDEQIRSNHTYIKDRVFDPLKFGMVAYIAV